MTKIVFLDIDGTILSHNTNTVPTSTKDTIQALQKKDIKVFVCSGRNKFEYDHLNQLDGIDFDGHIFMNGGMTLFHDEIILEHPINNEDLKTILDYTRIHPFPIKVVEKEIEYINYIDDYVQIAQEAIHTPLPEIGSFEGVLNKKLYQVILYPHNNIHELFSLLKETKATKWNDYGFDLMHKTSGKGVALQEVCNYFHIPISESLAIGDGFNDIEMLEKAGISIAMGNSVDELKKVSDYITKDIDKDGLYYALKYFELI